MQPGEIRQLWKYLSDQSLHIDMWDGDSLLLIGSTSLELKVSWLNFKSFSYLLAIPYPLREYVLG